MLNIFAKYVEVEGHVYKMTLVVESFSAFVNYSENFSFVPTIN